MNNIRKLTDSLFWVGVNDRRIALFENVYPVPTGMSYNSYVLLDEKTALFDTVDASFTHDFLENVTAALKGRTLDYLIVNHMEPDHCASIADVIAVYPEAKIVCTAKAVGMMKQFFDFDMDSRAIPVKEGDTISLGSHELTFVMAPMVHWPEVMVTYEKTEKILFSADAFGSFGAVDGNIFADEIDDKVAWLSEARRYYTNIVGKFGMSVQGLLKKAAGLEIRMICPLHSVIWREDLPWLIDKYLKWSSYTPDKEQGNGSASDEGAVSDLHRQCRRRSFKNHRGSQEQGCRRVREGSGPGQGRRCQKDGRGRPYHCPGARESHE